jgi:hypothetical protein
VRFFAPVPGESNYGAVSAKRSTPLLISLIIARVSLVGESIATL